MEVRQVEELQIELGIGDDSDPHELEAATAKLRRQLLELRVDDVRLARGDDAPQGARAGSTVELGMLIVALGRTPGVIASLGGALSAWIGSRNGRSAAIALGDQRIELTGVSADDQRRLLDLFEAATARERHAREP